MISIIVYGRNDERGYGMHKRVALSLNAMAAVLEESSSEIIFVDYNTPDHLPTLLELIRDTLTAEARERVRVLRVRPAVHARFLDLTPLPVLEPIARNVALRRTRAQNPWVLSTNTDDILVPIHRRSLDEIVRGLPAGYFVLPRFELPERVWETFDRLAPADTIEAAKEWGDIGRLNEVVHGEGAVLFDSPGDFQLVRRADLFSIDGFDEEMLLGWHVDHNLAARISVKLGGPASLADHLALYHCGHARTPTQTHAHDRIENDISRFVSRVVSPDLPHQRDKWGCVDDVIEEIDLRDPSAGGLKAAYVASIAPRQGALPAANYNKLGYDDLSYDAAHVAAHIIDLLSTYPRDAAIGFVGCRRDLLRILLKGLAELGFAYRVLAPEDLRPALIESAELQYAPVRDVLDAADVLLFEFGRASDGTQLEAVSHPNVPAMANNQSALETVAAAFRAAVERERDACDFGGRERLFIAVNAINNRFEELVSRALRATPSPFTTRLRYGPVDTMRSGPSGTLAEELARDLGYEAPVPAAELSAARGLFGRLLAAETVDPSLNLELAAASKLIGALVASPRYRTRLGRAGAAILERIRAASAPAPELFALKETFFLTSPAKTESETNVARLSDWKKSDWSAAARVVTGRAHRSAVRNGWIWERAQVLWGLSRRRGNAASALVVCEQSEPLTSALATAFGEIHLLDVREFSRGEAVALRSASDFAGGEFLDAERCRVVSLPDIEERRYDAIVLAHSAGWRRGLAGLATIVGKLRPVLDGKGSLVITGELSLLGSGRALRPDLGIARHFAGRLSEAAAMTPVGSGVLAADLDDAALVGTPEDLDAGRPVMGLQRAGDTYWPAVWFFEAAAPAPENVASAVAARLAGLMLGDQLPYLRAAERSTRDLGKIIGRAENGAGHIFYGPFLRLPAGRYRAQINLSRARRPGAGSLGRFVAEVGLGSDIVAQETIAFDAKGKRANASVTLPFAVSAHHSVAEAAAPCEIRLWSDGAADVTVDAVSLEAN